MEDMKMDSFENSDESLLNTTTESAKSIKPINKDTVHRICSGQVVLNLAIAVKELVENSLDAGATIIEIRLKEYGKESIEISDNGSGVTSDNFSGLTLKYHTSKLREFSDLLGVSTFGFRGEALSSLAALSDLVITTRHSSTEIGSKIEYDHKGEIKNIIPCARQVGTTVSLSNLFSTLPVRQKEFHRNLKREFNKMTQILYAYCLISSGVKIICTNQTSKGNKSTVVATQGGSLRDNIACVFGVKQLQTLLDLTPYYPDSYVGDIKKTFYDNLENEKTKKACAVSPNKQADMTDIQSDVELELSEDSSNDANDLSCTFDQKDSKENSELLEKNLSQVSDSSQLTIDSKKSIRAKRHPFDFSGFISSCAHSKGQSTTDRQFYFVNSRPCEPNKLMKIFNEIYRQYNPHQSPFVCFDLKLKRSAVDVNVTPDKRKVFLDREKHIMEVIKVSLNKLYENIPSVLKTENISLQQKNSSVDKTSHSAPRIYSSFLSQFVSKSAPIETVTSEKSAVELKRKSSSLDSFLTTCKVSRKCSPEPSFARESLVTVYSDEEIIDNHDEKELAGGSVINHSNSELNFPTNNDAQELTTMVDNTISEDTKETVFLGFTDSIPLSQIVNIGDVIDDSQQQTNIPIKKTPKKSPIKKVIIDSSIEKTPIDKKITVYNVTMSQIKAQMFENNDIKENMKTIDKVKFRSEINPLHNKKCEEELEKEISKEMFSEMRIIGQFNLGFIITQLIDDLFIVDQHATDEQYNFETLQKTTILSNQKLVVAQPLELTGVNERILIDNLEICRKNGFTFEINEDAIPTKRVKLVTIPISKNIIFGKEDIEEMLFMLKDAPNEICRPSRIRSMFASRACRKSVMIGSALSKTDMRKLIDHMGVIEKPWNGESPIAALAWAPNNKKLAIATHERTVILFDESGTKRDKFSTKPSDPTAGKKSYSILCLAFSNESDMIAVGQSDSMVFVYRIGEGWDSKKVICNKFPLSAACMCMYWSPPGTLYAGLFDGKIRSLDCKTNKGNSAWAGAAACISLSGIGGGLLVSGHIDGALLTSGSKLMARHPVAPTALCALENAILAGGCDCRIVVYDGSGRPLCSFDHSKDSTQREFTVACASASGQAAVIGSYDRCHVIEWNASRGRWMTGSVLNIQGLYAARALAWSRDGAKIAVGGFTGATVVFEAMLKRWISGGVLEVVRRGQGQLSLRKLSGDVPQVTIQATLGRDIHTVRVMGGDWYAVCRTESSLIVCDLARSLVSEVPWFGSGERFLFQNAPVCLIHRAGELSLIEYGIDSILASVRTEFFNPHLLSVRINEGEALKSIDNKKLAYLLDQKSVCVIDLITGLQVAQARLEARADWLELSESAHILLLRDRRRRLLLLNVTNGRIEVILSGVSFVQWVEGSDAVVAQTSTHLAVWYSINDVGLVELMECGGGVATQVEVVNGVPRVLLQGGSIPYITLDHARLNFCTALRSNDFAGCEIYLNSLGDIPQALTLWQQLANESMEIGNLKMAVRCWKALGDEARSTYLSRTLIYSEEYEKENNLDGMRSPHVRARLAVLSYDLKLAEKIYIEELNNPSLAITMYTNLHRWPEALAVADKLGLHQASTLREQYMSHLISSGAEGEAASLLVNNGDTRGALELVLRAGLPGRAARILRHSPALLADRDCITSVLQALLKNECWEQAAELCERAGEPEKAVQLYAKANSFAKAVQRARHVAPEEVTALEKSWGEWLVERRQWGAAVAHLIEAGDSQGALAAAVRAQQWAKALQIIQVIDDVESVQEYYEILADHYASIQEWETAEILWEAGGVGEQGARALGAAGEWGRALTFAQRLLGNTSATQIFLPEAERLKTQGDYREAENLYVGLGMADAAISMHEEAGRHAALLRLVGKHRPQLLGSARKRVAQSLKEQGRPRQAEHYYIEAGDWKGAIQMYRMADQWEDAYRIAQLHAPPQVQEQVVVAWSNSLEDDAAAARVLLSRNALEAGIRWAARGGRWARALALAHAGAPHLEAPVRAQMAAQLEDEGKLEEAEAEFVKGGSAGEAVDMWLHAQQHAKALSLAEHHAPEKEGEVLRAYGEWAEAQGDLQLYEALVIRAGRPQDIIKYYKENGMWDDAIRVCEEYLPQGVQALRAEASRAGGQGSYERTEIAASSAVNSEGADPETVLRAAAEHANNGQYWESIRSLLSIEVKNAGPTTVERATLRAARLARDHLPPNRAAQIAPLIAQRLTEAGQEAMGARLQDALLSMYADSDGDRHAAGDDNGHAEQLARRGEWPLALEAASAIGPAATARLAAKWAATLMQNHDTLEYQKPDGAMSGGVASAIAVLSRWGASASELRTLIQPMLARASALPNPPYTFLRDLRNVLHSIVSNNGSEGKGAMERVVEASTLLCVREACRSIPSLKPLALRAAAALLRHTDLVAADNAFCAAGMLLRDSEREGEALVFLNRYLDLAEAADTDGDDAAPLDHADFGETDFPHEVVLGGSALSPQDHDEVREWVLAVSLDQNVTQSLPLDKRGLYECCLGPGDVSCVLTGFPLSTRVVHFTNGRGANRDAWAKLQLHCSTEPASDAADCRRFLTSWCGPDDYSLT